MNVVNEIWSARFVSDALFDGRHLCARTLRENYSRECLAIDAGQSLNGHDLVCTRG